MSSKTTSLLTGAHPIEVKMFFDSGGRQGNIQHPGEEIISRNTFVHISLFFLSFFLVCGSSRGWIWAWHKHWRCSSSQLWVHAFSKYRFFWRECLTQLPRMVLDWRYSPSKRASNLQCVDISSELINMPYQMPFVVSHRKWAHDDLCEILTQYCS